MLWHQDVSSDNKVVTLSYPFQFLFEYVVRGSGVKERQSSVTTEGNEVKFT